MTERMAEAAVNLHGTRCVQKIVEVMQQMAVTAKWWSAARSSIVDRTRRFNVFTGSGIAKCMFFVFSSVSVPGLCQLNARSSFCSPCIFLAAA